MATAENYYIDALADAIHERMARAVLAMPVEFKERVLLKWAAPPMQIPMRDPVHGYFLLCAYVTATGGMLMRIQDHEGFMIKEWIME